MEEHVRSTSQDKRPVEYKRLAKGASGLAFWLPLAALSAFALVVLPVIVAPVARWTGVSFATSAGISDFLVTLGGVMGAIFTVGGLVIALVSVFTQLSIEDRISQGIEKLLPELDERAQLQIEAYLAFTRATEEGDWRRTVELAQDALTKWPSLQGARSFVGERLSDLAIEWYARCEIEGARPAPFSVTYSGDIISDVGFQSVYGFNIPPRLSEILYMSRDDVPVMEAITWLNDAIRHGEKNDAQLRAKLALLYGIAGRFREMKSQAQKALELDSSLADDLAKPRNLATLACGCRNALTAEGQLAELGQLLGRQLPATVAQLLDSLRRVNMSSGTYDWNVYWVAFDRPSYPPNLMTNDLITLHIQLGGTSNERTAAVKWRMAGTNEEHRLTDPQEKVPIEDIVERIAAKFILVCEYSVRLQNLRWDR